MTDRKKYGLDELRKMLGPSGRTAGNIVSNFAVMMRELGADDVLAVYDPADGGATRAEQWLEGREMAPASKARYYSSLLSVANPSKAAAEIARLVPDSARERLRKRLHSHDRSVRESMDNNIASDRELKSILPWQDIVSAYEEKRPSLDDRQGLIADLYIGYASDPAGAPRRLDYNAVRVYAARPGGARAAPNYVVVRPPDSVTLHLSEFKTAASREEPIDVQLPQGLSESIVRSLGGRPWRRYLLQKTRAGGRAEPLTPHLLGYHVKQTTLAITGREIPVNGLRKSFITWLHSQNLSVAVLKSFAYQMGHSVETASLYRKLNIGESVALGRRNDCLSCGGSGHWADQCTNGASQLRMRILPPIS